MSTMIVKVARTLEPQAWAALDGQDSLSYRNRRVASMRKARAAIEAMMEPTEEVCRIAREDRAFLDRTSYRALIEAALKEGQ